MKPTCIAITVASLLVLAEPSRAATSGARPAAPQAGRPQPSRPQTPPPGWSETKKKALDLMMAGKDLAAIAVFEKWVAVHPAFGEGYFWLGAAHEGVGRATFTSRAPDAQTTRTTHFEAAALHMRRGLELAGPDTSFMELRSLIDLHGVIGLNRPAEYERLVREAVARHPAEPLAHAYLLQVLATRGEPIEAAARAARAAMPTGPDARVALAGSLVAKVRDLGRLTPALGPALLPEASRLVEEALTLKPGDAHALRVRGDIEALRALVPGRPVADEVGLSGAMRAVRIAQAVYSSSCGQGHYAPTLAALARPAPGDKRGFLPGDLVPAAGGTVVEKYGYRIEMIAVTAPKSPASCNGVPAGGSADRFSVVARPKEGFQGRAFRIDAEGDLTAIK
jgi:hypothetical protein